MIGSHIAAIFPIVDWDVSAITTPSVTIQLQRIPLATAMATPGPPSRAYPSVFASAIDASCRAIGGSGAGVAVNGGAEGGLATGLPRNTRRRVLNSAPTLVRPSRT